MFRNIKRKTKMKKIIKNLPSLKQAEQRMLKNKKNFTYGTKKIKHHSVILASINLSVNHNQTMINDSISNLISIIKSIKGHDKKYKATIDGKECLNNISKVNKKDAKKINNKYNLSKYIKKINDKKCLTLSNLNYLDVTGLLKCLPLLLYINPLNYNESENQKILHESSEATILSCSLEEKLLPHLSKTNKTKHKTIPSDFQMIYADRKPIKNKIAINISSFFIYNNDSKHIKNLKIEEAKKQKDDFAIIIKNHKKYILVNPNSTFWSRCASSIIHLNNVKSTSKKSYQNIYKRIMASKISKFSDTTKFYLKELRKSSAIKELADGNFTIVSYETFDDIYYSLMADAQRKYLLDTSVKKQEEIEDAMDITTICKHTLKKCHNTL